MKYQRATGRPELLGVLPPSDKGGEEGEGREEKRGSSCIRAHLGEHLQPSSDFQLASDNEKTGSLTNGPVSVEAHRAPGSTTCSALMVSTLRLAVPQLAAPLA